MTVGACKTHRFGYEVASLGAKAQAARLPPREPEPRPRSPRPPRSGARSATGARLQAPGRGPSRPHLRPRVHSASAAEGCLRPLAALLRPRPPGPPETSAASRPRPLPAPEGEDAAGTPPAGCPRRGQAAPGPQPLRANRGARREGPLPLPLRNHPLPQASRARAGIGFPCARNPASSPIREHPRFSASQENKTNRIFLASLGSCAVRHNLSQRGHRDQITWDASGRFRFFFKRLCLELS